MKKRTDRKIAVGGVAVTAIVLPGVMVVLAQTGWGKPASSNGTPEAAVGTSLAPEMPGPGVAVQPSVPATSPPTSARPMTSYPFSSGHPKPQVSDPDRQSGLHGKRTRLPQGATSAPDGRGGVYRSADDGAKVTQVKKVGTRLYDLTIAAPSLGSSVKTRLLVPKSWSAGANRTWPVVYAYHGGQNNYLSWTKDSNLPQVAAGNDVMVVMPEGGSTGSYTNWWNGGKGGIPEWETFHIQEVIPLMERNFHAGTARAAIGLSSGGQGAITYAERHPGLFRYAASYSGALNITAPGMPTVLTQMMNKGVDPYAIWGDPARDRANWQAHDATVMAAKLKGIGVYVSSGNGQIGPYDKSGTAPWDAGRVGEGFAGTMNANFVRAARQAGVAVTANLYGPGTHKWAYWKRELVASWPAITAAIGAGRS